MQERNDGSFGEIMDSPELLKELINDPEELARTKNIHFGTEKELERIKTDGAFGNGNVQKEDGSSVKEYLRRVEDKLDMVIKHFNIIRIIG